MESFSRMLNAQMVLLVYLAVGMYCMKAGLIDRETKKKLVRCTGRPVPGAGKNILFF